MSASSHCAIEPPSEWVRRFSTLIPVGGRVLDLACGNGRHARLLATLGYRVAAVDRDVAAVTALTGLAGVRAKVADLEHAPWPYEDERFDGVLVTNYLHRPLLARLLDSLEPGGVLIYETFARGNERFGRPSNPHFLLDRGELLRLVWGRLHVVAYEDLYTAQPRPAVVQRICAVNDLEGGAHGGSSS